MRPLLATLQNLRLFYSLAYYYMLLPVKVQPVNTHIAIAAIFSYTFDIDPEKLPGLRIEAQDPAAQTAQCNLYLYLLSQ